MDTSTFAERIKVIGTNPSGFMTTEERDREIRHSAGRILLRDFFGWKRFLPVDCSPVYRTRAEVAHVLHSRKITPSLEEATQIAQELDSVRVHYGCGGYEAFDITKVQDSRGNETYRLKRLFGTSD